MRKLIGLLAFSAATLGATSAFAQMEEFGKSGSMGFSAERLFGFYSLHLSGETSPPQNAGYDDSATGFGFGWGADSYPFNIPRFGFDIFVIDQLSLGGSIGYASLSDKNYGCRGNNNCDPAVFGGDIEAFLLAFRVGYWIPIAPVIGFWPRGGFTWHSVDPPGNQDNSQRGMALTLEGLFGIGPVEHFAFLAGPTFDIDFIGSADCPTNPEPDATCSYKYRNIGLQVGVMGWL
jgi:hypothetical protein